MVLLQWRKITAWSNASTKGSETSLICCGSLIKSFLDSENPQVDRGISVLCKAHAGNLKVKGALTKAAAQTFDCSTCAAENLILGLHHKSPIARVAIAGMLRSFVSSVHLQLGHKPLRGGRRKQEVRAVCRAWRLFQLRQDPNEFQQCNFWGDPRRRRIEILGSCSQDSCAEAVHSSKDPNGSS